MCAGFSLFLDVQLSDVAVDRSRNTKANKPSTSFHLHFRADEESFVTLNKTQGQIKSMS